MEDLIKRIVKLSQLEKRDFIDTFFDQGDDAISRLLGTLKRWDDEERGAFIKALPQDYGAWVAGQLEKAAPADDRTKKSVERTMATALRTVPARIRKIERGMTAVNKAVLANRRLLRSGFATLDNVISDQQRGKPRPPVQKPHPKNGIVVDLPKPDKSVVRKGDLYDLIDQRRSRRKFTDRPLSLAELSYLLWATQGVRKLSDDRRMSMRTVPSAGSMHPFETYVAVNSVDGVKPGLYRYQAADHTLAFLRQVKGQQDAVAAANFGQKFVGHCAATFFWTAVPYKTEWRYVTESAKLILLDAGHVCQNFYLACESIGCGTCAIGAYDQDKVDRLLRVDGTDELVVYIAPVGKVGQPA
ncbi:MAG: SagB/ThcOx family dehydrogenase [Candidatus Edwardsbacteria bacterium]|jgi:SagB-type dehydrogenase family enzyme|nr:SagB/ThcOx family dehydrogenase [Candidatus Edwardsbacteria bacterium]